MKGNVNLKQPCGERERAMWEVARSGQLRIAVVAATVLAVTSAHATTFTVTNNNDSGLGSLRDAVAQANANPGPDTIAFAAAVAGTILLTTGQIAITGPITIVGPGSGALTIDANANSRVFSIFENAADVCATPGTNFPVSISGLTLTNAEFGPGTDEGGGAIYTEKSLTVSDIVISNSQAGEGGGLQMRMLYPGQSLSIVDSQFVNNLARYFQGGGGYMSGGGLEVEERCFGLPTNPGSVSISIAASLFSGNHAKTCDVLCGFSSGGGIFVVGAADVTITDSRIVGNVVDVPADPVAQLLGGGVSVLDAKSLTIERTEISGNSGAYVGGGVSLKASFGAPAMTGAIVNSTISGNSARGAGGAGIFVQGDVLLLLENSTVSDNEPGTSTWGGILLEAFWDPPPSLTLSSSIVAKSRNGASDIEFISNPTAPFIVSASQSLVGTVGPGASVAGAGNLFGVDPLLGPLAFNGGPTRTQALLAGSPAINAGSNPYALLTDQRGAGFARVVGAAADMGAYETTSTLLTNGDNYQGMWWKADESGWGVNFAHQGDQIFATWFTYDTSGNAYWLSMPAVRISDNAFHGDVYVDVGPPFNNFTGSGLAFKVGDGTITFSDANTGTFTYNLNPATAGAAAAISQSKPITRFVFGGGALPVCKYQSAPDLTAATNYQDLWWLPSESGWGASVAHQGNLMYVIWYTYDAKFAGINAPLWLTSLLSRQGTSNVFTGQMYRTSGPRFDDYKTSDEVQPATVVGNATVTFADGNHATFHYATTGTGGLPVADQTKSITRFLLAPPAATVCQ